jgi:dipeptidyl aminopeptidase/acylaminoacyl peptidase
MGATPYADAETYDRHSPHRRVAAWRSPTLVIHGERDYRVPVGEALALFEALQHHGVPSELLMFPDEHHWITRPRNIVAWYETVVGFLARYMG